MKMFSKFKDFLHKTKRTKIKENTSLIKALKFYKAQNTDKTLDLVSKIITNTFSKAHIKHGNEPSRTTGWSVKWTNH